jgi:hypothetical protein
MNVFLVRSLTDYELLLFHNCVGESREAIFAKSNFFDVIGFDLEWAENRRKIFAAELDRRGHNDNFEKTTPKVCDAQFITMMIDHDLQFLCSCLSVTISALSEESFSSRVGVEKDIAIEIYECLLTELKQR